MDLPTDIEGLVALLLRRGWKEDVAVSPRDVAVHLLRDSDGFVFEARQERKVWKGRLDRGDGWRSLEYLAMACGGTSNDAFDLSASVGAGPARAYQNMKEPQQPYVRWETLVPRCIEWLRAAPPAPTQPSGDIFASLARRDFHQACIDIINRRTHGLHLRPMPPAPTVAQQSPLELLGWLRQREIHKRIRSSGSHLLDESGDADRLTAIGGDSQMLWIAYLDEPNDSLDPEVVIHDHVHHDFIRGELLASMPLSRFIFDCLVRGSDFHSVWTRPADVAQTESVLWSEDTSELTMRGVPPSAMRVGATWMQLHTSFFVDDPVQAGEELGDAAELHTLFEWGTRTLQL